MKKITITTEQSGQRLDRFLAGELKDFSRSHIQKLINDGQVLVNGKIPVPHCKLKEKDAIAVKGTAVKAKKKEGHVFKLPEPEIVAETGDYLVINKPAGLVVHGAPHIQEPTLVDFLLRKYPKIEKVGEDPHRPGIMHRLDKDVSGLMVVAKNQEAFMSLKRQFKDRTMDKQYIGLIYGKITKDHGIINFPIERSTSGHKMAAKPASSKGKASTEGKEAITEFLVEKKFYNYTLLRIKIKTGRTHQIRAHMAAFGHPIVGDPLYGTVKTRSLDKKLGIKRNFLVASKLAFIDLEGQRQEFEIGLPGDLRDLLARLK